MTIVAAKVDPQPWSERVIAQAVAMQTLKRNCVVLVDRCNWTGHECDVLAVTRDLRIIDVEVKISRADFKADAKKRKWWRVPRVGHDYERVRKEMKADKFGGRRYTLRPDVRFLDGELGPPQIGCREHPPKVWKHYFAMPREVWTDDLVDRLPSPDCGVLLLDHDRHGRAVVRSHRRAKPNRQAYRLTAREALDVARLANLRMWDAYETLERRR